MTTLSVLTIVRNRAGHLQQLVEGLKRSSYQPDELVVIDMSDQPVTIADQAFPIRIERIPTDGLPLAAARNRAAALAIGEHLVFLDVDCIPMASCLGSLHNELLSTDGLLCADVRYLGPQDARGRWTEDGLISSGRSHPVRAFPTSGIREEFNAGLFWSLAFAIRKTSFNDLGGFDEGFAGYGAEDTDFGFSAAKSGLRLYFVGGAIACHQFHESYEPPVQHVRDIVRNANRFRQKWGSWPMEGWLKAFSDMGMVDWNDGVVEFQRLPTAGETAAAKVGWSKDVLTRPTLDRSGDRVVLPT
jgi:GT2 family glycosyltransferase